MTFYVSTYERSTEELVGAYVLSRSKDKFLSIQLAIRAIRTLSPAVGRRSDLSASITALTNGSRAIPDISRNLISP